MEFTKEELYQKFAEVPIMPLSKHPDIEINKAMILLFNQS
jgi:hypothetical protein